MKIQFYFNLIICLMFVLSSCAKLRPNKPKLISSCQAITCHPNTPLQEYPPESGKHIKHIAKGYICENCHNQYLKNSHHKDSILDKDLDTELVFFDSLNPNTTWDNTTSDCSNILCHGQGSAKINWYDPFDGSCTVCHAPGSSIDPITTSGSGVSGKHVAHVTNRIIGCEVCHEGYRSDSNHMNGIYGKDESDTIVTIDTDGSQESPWGSISATFNDSTGQCDNISCHNGTGGVTWYSDSSGCTACHSSGSSIDPMTTSGSGTDGKHSAHVTNKGIGCEICHEDYKNDADHINGTYGKLEATSIIAMDTDGSQGSPWGSVSATFNDSTGQCDNISCHNGTGGVTWYSDSSGCTACHSSALGNTRQVMGAGGDFEKESHHVIDYANRTTEIVANSDCSVCHELSAHMSGTVKLNNKDSAGVAITYDPLTPSSLEPFCLSCHDADGATTEASPFSPFSSSNTLGTVPNAAGDKIYGYWNNTYTMHKDNGLTCAGSGDPGTGCHGNSGSINMHGSDSRGLLTKNMTFPVPSKDSDPTPRDPGNQTYIDYINNLYKLCFECHNNYSAVTKETVLGYKEGGNYDLFWAPTPYYTSSIQSLFRDVYTGGSEVYDDTIWGDPTTPLHNYHLLTTDNMMQGVWAYRGDSGETGRASCTTCHNVHGTSGSERSTYDEFGITAFTNGADEYKKFVPDSNYDDSVMKAYPINCAVNCHGIMGPTHYWYEPSNE